ncbi:MAG: hypothetical protein MUO76_19665, partial [Anaerolineaceae bacterium]|nr:hypothetical protein [Anaerolineaceae bacterium]
RSFDNNTSYNVSVFRGLDEDAIDLHAAIMVLTTGATYCGVGIGLDLSTEKSADIYQGSSQNLIIPVHAKYTGKPGLGYHIFYAIEYGGTGCTFYGQPGTPALCGMTGLVRY